MMGFGMNDAALFSVKTEGRAGVEAKLTEESYLQPYLLGGFRVSLELTH
jgi:hypothetical protein